MNQVQSTPPPSSPNKQQAYTSDKPFSHLDEVNIIGQIADLKIEYEKINLLLISLIELLDEKGIISKQELSDKAAELDI